jgi:hypothetical protein
MLPVLFSIVLQPSWAPWALAGIALAVGAWGCARRWRPLAALLALCAVWASPVAGAYLVLAAAGAGIAGLVGALIGAGIPEEEANYYQGEFESGRTIVTVQADGRADEAMAILSRHNAYDMSTRGDVTSTAPTAATEPLDVPVRSEDVIDLDRIEETDGTRGTGRPTL